MLHLLAAAVLSVPVPVADPGFQNGTGNVPGIPGWYGYWGYDRTSFVDPLPWMQPHIFGGRVMQFVGTLPIGNAYPSSRDGSQTIQLIPMTAIPDYDPSLPYKLTMTAWVTRVLGNEQTDKNFYFAISAHGGEPVGYDSFATHGLAWTELYQDILSWEETAFWTPVSISVVAPAGAEYIALQIAAREDVFNNTQQTGGVEFDGHYLGHVALDAVAVPEFSALWLVSIHGAILAPFAMRRRVRHLLRRRPCVH